MTERTDDKSLPSFPEWWDTFGRARWQSEDARDHKTAAELAWNAALAQRPSVVPQGYKLLKDTTFAERSYPEHLSHENGSYHCTCCECGRTFQGHKRTVICKVCVTTPPSHARQACPDCKGSGTVKGVTQQHGPDDYEFDVTCPTCEGTGETVVAWLHRSKSTAFVITDTVKNIWLKVHPTHVENYTVPLYFGDTLGNGK